MPRNPLMNFISHPSAGSPLTRPSPVGIGGMTSAGPGARTFAGPGRTSLTPGERLSNIGMGLALAYDGRYSPHYRSGVGSTLRGIGAGLQLNQQAAVQGRQEALEWAKLQAQLDESAAKRSRWESELAEIQRSREEATATIAARAAMLSQDENLTPEQIELMKRGGPAYEEYLLAQRPPKPGTPKTRWGPLRQQQIGGRNVWTQTSDTGETKVVFNEELPVPGGGEALGTTGSLRMVNEEGAHPDPRMTEGQAIEQGFRVMNTAQQNRLTALKGAKVVVSQLEDMLLSEDEIDVTQALGQGAMTGTPVRKKKGISWGNEAGILEMAKNWTDAQVEAFAQADPRYRSYMSFSEGTIVPLVRSLGEVGNLSQTEIDRGLSLIPKAWDTPQVARRKIDELRGLFAEWTDEKRESNFGDDEDLQGLGGLRDFLGNPTVAPPPAPRVMGLPPRDPIDVTGVSP